MGVWSRDLRYFMSIAPNGIPNLRQTTTNPDGQTLNKIIEATPCHLKTLAQVGNMFFEKVVNFINIRKSVFSKKLECFIYCKNSLRNVPTFYEKQVYELKTDRLR